MFGDAWRAVVALPDDDAIDRRNRRSCAASVAVCERVSPAERLLTSVIRGNTRTRGPGPCTWRSTD